MIKSRKRLFNPQKSQKGSNVKSGTVHPNQQKKTHTHASHFPNHQISTNTGGRLIKITYNSFLWATWCRSALDPEGQLYRFSVKLMTTSIIFKIRPVRVFKKLTFRPTKENSPTYGNFWTLYPQPQLDIKFWNLWEYYSQF